MFLFDKVNGQYYWHACISAYDFPPESLTKTLAKFTRVHGTTVLGREARVFAPPTETGPQIYNQLRSILTTIHERHHHQDFTTTPIGWCLWRTSNAITSTRAYLLHKASRLEKPVLAALPATLWTERLPKKYSVKLDELDILCKFHSAVWERAHITIGEFVGLANKAGAILVQRGELLPPNLQWTSNLPREEALLESLFTTYEIVEAGARLRERMAMESVGTVDDIRQWERDRVHGVYQPAYDYLMDQLGSAAVALLAITLSLMGPADPGLSGKAFVETTVPGWRLKSAVKTLQSIIWPEAYDYLAIPIDVFDDICLASGFGRPSETLRLLAEKEMSPPESHTRDAVAGGDDPNNSIFSYYVYLQNQARMGLERRLQTPILSVTKSFQPPLEFYSDRVVMNLPEGEEKFPLAYRAFCCLIFDIVVQACFKAESQVEFLAAVEICRQLETRLFCGGQVGFPITDDLLRQMQLEHLLGVT